MTLILLSPAQAEPKKPAAPGANPARVHASLSRLPLRFEKNVGQTNSSVHYLCRTSGYMLFLTQKEAVMTLRAPEESSSSRANSQKTDSRSAVVRLRFQGGDSTPQIVGQEKQEGITNYLRGKDPSRWHTNVPSFRKVVYRKVYPGIDAVFYGNARKLEYDFLVAPGANPKHIRLAVEGASRLHLDKRGDLLLETSAGTLVQKAPVVYQTIGGKKEIVPAKYTLLGDAAPRGKSIGIRLGKYDRTLPLVIDPTLDYSTFLGGSSFADLCTGIVADNSGNAYVIGNTPNSSFPTTSGAYQTTHGGGGLDITVTKLNSSGTALVYSTFLGGSAGEQIPGGNQIGDNVAGRNIAIDSSGNAYVTGRTYSTDFPTTPGAYQTTPTGNANVFVTKLNSSGNGLVYSTVIYGSSGQGGLPIALRIDSSGNAYIAGQTATTNFPTTSGAYQTSGFGSFITKLNSNGTALVFSTIFPTNSLRALALDSSNNVYIAGYNYGFTGGGFPTTTGAYQTTPAGGSNDAFVTKLNSSGTALVYSTYVGGSADDRAYGLAVDSSGNAYVTGITHSSGFPTTTGAYQTTHGGGGEDAFVAKLNSSGSALTYSTFLGGSLRDLGFDLTVDGSGYAYVAGRTGDTSQGSANNFPTTVGAYQTSSGSNVIAVFMTVLNTSGSSLEYSTYLGGAPSGGYGFAAGYAIALDPSGNIYVTGEANTGFPTTSGAYQTSSPSGTNGFVAKFTGL
jgi:hypothetical protein